MSQIEAAVAVLANAKQPMNCKAMVEAMQVEGLWASSDGATRNILNNNGPRLTLRSFARSKAKEVGKVDRKIARCLMQKAGQVTFQIEPTQQILIRPRNCVSEVQLISDRPLCWV